MHAKFGTTTPIFGKPRPILPAHGQITKYFAEQAKMLALVATKSVF
jgi:hypothetical protein